MSTADLVELIKAIGTAVSVIIGAVTIGYARVSAKRAKETLQQTTTTTHVDGKVKRKSAAETAEEALGKANALQVSVDNVIGRLAAVQADLATRPGTGTRRATPEEDDPW